jgi:hypothetical protein
VVPWLSTAAEEDDIRPYPILPTPRAYGARRKKQPASGLQQVKGRLFNRPAPQPGLMPSLVWPVERRQFLLERFIEQFMPMLAKKHK